MPVPTLSGTVTRIISPVASAPPGGGGAGGAKTNLLSWWDQTEASGNRADSFGSNTFVDNNTVTSRAGLLTPTLASSHDSTLAEHFSVASGHNLAFDTHNVIATVGWYLFDKSFIPNYMIHVGSDWSSSTQYAYSIRRNASSTAMEARAGGASGGATSIIGATVANATWVFVYAYWNWDTEEMGLSLDDGTVTTASLTGKTPMITPKIFYQGFAPTTYDLDGATQSIAIYNGQLDPAVVTTLYNSGTPLLYEDL